MNFKKGFRRLVVVLSISLSVLLAAVVYIAMGSSEETIKWSEIKNSEKFKALNQEQQDIVKVRYWDSVISQDYQVMTLDRAQRQQLKYRFFGLQGISEEQAQMELKKYEAIAELEKQGKTSAPSFDFTVKRYNVVFRIFCCFLGGAIFFLVVWLVYFGLEWIVSGFLG